MSQITMYDYLANSVPAKCQNILDRYDIPASQTADELTENIKAYVRVYGQEALEELADIHPDKELIAEMSSFAPQKEPIHRIPQEREYLNATGTIDRITSIENRLMSGGTNSDTSLSKNDVIFGLGIAVLAVTLFK